MELVIVVHCKKIPHHSLSSEPGEDGFLYLKNSIYGDSKSPLFFYVNMKQWEHKYVYHRAIL